MWELSSEAKEDAQELSSEAKEDAQEIIKHVLTIGPLASPTEDVW